MLRHPVPVIEPAKEAEGEQPQTQPGLSLLGPGCIRDPGADPRHWEISDITALMSFRFPCGRQSQQATALITWIS